MYEYLQAWSAIDTTKQTPWTLTGITAPSPITDKISFCLDLDFAVLTMYYSVDLLQAYTQATL